MFANDGKTRNEHLSSFYGASSQQTDNVEPRANRLASLLGVVANALWGGEVADLSIARRLFENRVTESEQIVSSVEALW
ncbi:hypothetical protein N1031_19880 [Herbiconiux moechotypicola]|uniref:hypothetical protein n=1 Tax=Herbiconiux moechotypicola TaxID=637393 RepID=UPI00217CD9E6|nr:hypothetical protein [Herbiconiux moechotypicola]MCS5732022.1 hypothetical protein [Herbiconiux moechotypicola]